MVFWRLVGHLNKIAPAAAKTSPGWAQQFNWRGINKQHLIERTFHTAGETAQPIRERKPFTQGVYVETLKVLPLRDATLIRSEVLLDRPPRLGQPESVRRCIFNEHNLYWQNVGHSNDSVATRRGFHAKGAIHIWAMARVSQAGVQ